MKTQKINNTTLKTKGIKDTVQFGIKKSGIAHIFNVLRNQLYTDKVLAVIREYVANAIDANVEAGKADVPVVVTLPTRLDLHFKVRDFGKALTQQDIHEIYAMYGESTKRHTNTQIGMLGIGSKSAFAYGDNFVINSFVDGVKHSYNAFIDPSQIGMIAKLSEGATDEKDGLEIIVPVKEYDTEEFQEKASQMFKLFKIKPKVRGGSPDYFDKIQKEDKILFSGDDWEFLLKKDNSYNSDERAIAIMGNIGYPIDRRGLGYGDDEAIGELLNSNIRIEFEIGELEIAANREGLQYTDYTKKNIISKLKKVRDEMGDKIVAKFEGCKSLFETKQLYYSLFDLAEGLYNVRKIIQDRIQFGGRKVTNNEFKHHGQNDEDMTMFKYEKKRTRYSPSKKWTMYVKDDTIIVHNDTGHRRGAMAKVLPLALGERKDVYVMEWSDNKAREAFEEKTGFDAPMLKMSELEKGDLSQWGYGSTIAKEGGGFYSQNPQNRMKVLELDTSDNTYHERDKARSYATSWKETEADIENGVGVYVVIDKYKIVHNDPYLSDIKPYEIIEKVLDNLEELGIEVPTVIGVKRSMVEKVNKSNWVTLEDYVDTQLKNLIAINKISELHHNKEAYQRMDNNVLEMVKGIKNDITLSESVGSKLAQLANPFDRDAKVNFGGPKLTVQRLFNLFETIRRCIGIGVKFGKKKGKTPIEKLYEEATEMYPMLDQIETWRWRDDKKKVKAITDYVNLVDLNNIPAMLS